MRTGIGGCLKPHKGFLHFEANQNLQIAGFNRAISECRNSQLSPFSNVKKEPDGGMK